MGKRSLNIAVILPAFNEEMTVEYTIKSFHRELPDARIIVVNNNSQDRTAVIARDTLDRLGTSGMVIDELRQGKGNAVRSAFAEIDADIYVLCDADLTYPAAQVHDLILPVAQNRADMVVGDRRSGGHYKNENKRNFHDFGNELVKWLINKLFRADLADIMSGYRVFSRKFVKNYPIMVEGFQIETDMTLHALDKRFRIIEIPVEYKDRPSGSFSKLNTFSDGAKVLFTIAQILRYYRPLLFFGGMSMLFGLMGLVAGTPVFLDWIRYSYVYHVPLAILAAALEMVAVMALSAGLILDSISHQHKIDFEKTLLNMANK
jgi:glycosyltransferase involved in cell wall biosynthesis